MLMNDLYLQQMKELLTDEEYEKYLKLLDQPHQRGIRVNTLKTDAAELFELTGLAGEKSPFAENWYFLASGAAAGKMPAYRAGLFYIQEPSASAAVTVLDPQPGMKVLDLCAAPGSKSTQIAEKLGNTGFLCVNEYVRKRAQVLLENIELNGTANCMVLNADTADVASAFPEYFDAVLCDAPCSGEGMFRKEEDAVRDWSPQNVLLCAERQRMILENAYKCLKPGGVLVYSTCTFNKTENEETVLHFLNLHDNMVMENAGVSFGRRGMIKDHGIDSAVRIFPMDGGEGHFIAKMRKTGTSAAAKEPGLMKSDPIDRSARAFLEEMLETPYPYLFQKAGRVYGGTQPFVSAGSCHLIRSQVFLGEVIKGRFEPSHHFFLSSFSRFIRTAELNDEDIIRYFHGEQIAGVFEKGWTAVTWHGHAVGGAKSDGRNLKNKYPKQLRFR
ncbi:MAG: NOL1/NOP2/sun family putative RNA methylase [Erysipelotrichaceae bacterium]|nr:NOL1/NOP2/sun family putative RNA methylase [Erysipelotrichaceae bacterium]